MKIADAAFRQRLEIRRAQVLQDLRTLQAGADTVTRLEELWYTCKFVVLEGDPASYFRIRELFNRYRKHEMEFAELKDGVFHAFFTALTCEIEETNLVNLLTHIWGFLKKHVDGEGDRAQALDLIGTLSAGDLSVVPTLYEHLDSLHFKYGKTNLLNPKLQ
ncbi:DUF1722 domain-containing protein [Tumebacillus sp. ITR2]|uniref:DUF1722 domain-containing protein n=1 Tax=Tumebacillus amylolyticus TaxID=2801339 RepID=A0ABS1J696_9BACL|nr:DUF1722 domain-containing protein [Tumebacillus amylolyticus]MBL0385802.1 DUF1722 domain-containing protein [Tumebacillus amylolyticus]